MTVDLVVLALVALGAVFGARAGAARQLAGWGALVLAALAARPGGALLGKTFAQAFHTSEALGAVAAGFATFVVVAVMVRFVGKWMLQGVLGGSDPADRGTDRALGALLGGAKLLAVAWVAISALVFVEDNVQFTGKGLGVSPKDSTAFAIARQWNLFSSPFFSGAADLLAAQKIFRSPELFQKLQANPAVAALQKNPHFRAVLANPEVKEALDRGDLVSLLKNASVHRLLQDSEARGQLAKLREAVDEVKPAVTSKPVAPRPAAVK